MFSAVAAVALGAVVVMVVVVAVVVAVTLFNHLFRTSIFPH